MNPQSSLVDNRIRPGAGDQLIFVDRLAGSLNERDQYIYRPAVEA
jgi:hypothetical protein